MSSCDAAEWLGETAWDLCCAVQDDRLRLGQAVRCEPRVDADGWVVLHPSGEVLAECPDELIADFFAEAFRMGALAVARFDANTRGNR